MKMTDEDIWTTDERGNPVQIPGTGTKKTTQSTLDENYIQNIKEMDSKIKQKKLDDFPTPQPKTFFGKIKKTINEKGEQISSDFQAKQEIKVMGRRYEKYNSNVFIRDERGNWQFYTVVDDYGEKTIPTGRTDRNGKQIYKKIKELDYIKSELNKQHVPYAIKKGEVAKNLKELQSENSYVVRLGKTWTKNIAETSKDIQKEYTKKGGFSSAMASAFDTEKSGMPSMAVPAWGSMFPHSGIPKQEQLPSFQSYKEQPPAKKPKKKYLQHEEYSALLQQGFTEAQLDEAGVQDKRSKNFQETSIWGRGVAAYKPLSVGQCILQAPDFPKSEFAKRKEVGQPWQGFRPPNASPMILGSKDQFGNRQTSFKPPFLTVPNIGTPRDEFGRQILFRPVFASPMKEEYQIDASGNVVMKKRFYQPIRVKL